MLENFELPLPASQDDAEEVLANILAADPEKINDDLNSKFYQFILNMFQGVYCTEGSTTDVNGSIADIEDTLSSMDSVLGEAYSINHHVLEDKYNPKIEIEIYLADQLLLHMLMDPLLAQVMTKKRLREFRSRKPRK